jgi:hypothetical protein
MEQLRELAELNDEILAFYQMRWDSDYVASRQSGETADSRHEQGVMEGYAKPGDELCDHVADLREHRFLIMFSRGFA